VDLKGRTLGLLRELVSFDTRNPPRRTRESGVVSYLEAVLSAASCTVVVADHGDGCINVLGYRGRPKVLRNVHVDTVPLAANWTSEPFVLTVGNDRATGLGAADAKGGLAAILAAAQVSSGDFALLVSSDEEAGQARCIRQFLGAGMAPFASVRDSIACAIVGEPTSCRALLRHRGVVTATGTFHGTAGHSSGAAPHSANHSLVKWGAAALAEVDAGKHGDVRFNIGRIEGGEKPNMIADRAITRVGLRTPPGVEGRAILESLQAGANAASWEPGFYGPPLPGPGTPDKNVDIARKWAALFGAETLESADFWTEAALFAEAGVPAFVFGPGSIATAHAPDEWVPIDELATAALLHKNLIDGRYDEP
jgi:acetylornithine deacetylase